MAAQRNGLATLANVLFDQINDLRNPDLSTEQLKAEIERSRAVNEIAKTTIDVSNSMMAAINLRNRVAIDAESHHELKTLSGGTSEPF